MEAKVKTITKWHSVPNRKLLEKIQTKISEHPLRTRFIEEYYDSQSYDLLRNNQWLKVKISLKDGSTGEDEVWCFQDSSRKVEDKLEYNEVEGKDESLARMKELNPKLNNITKENLQVEMLRIAVLYTARYSFGGDKINVDECFYDVEVPTNSYAVISFKDNWEYFKPNATISETKVMAYLWSRKTTLMNSISHEVRPQQDLNHSTMNSFKQLWPQIYKDVSRKELMVLYPLYEQLSEKCDQILEEYSRIKERVIKKYLQNHRGEWAGFVPEAQSIEQEEFILACDREEAEQRVKMFMAANKINKRYFLFHVTDGSTGVSSQSGGINEPLIQCTYSGYRDRILTSSRFRHKNSSQDIHNSVVDTGSPLPLIMSLQDFQKQFPNHELGSDYNVDNTESIQARVNFEGLGDQTDLANWLPAVVGPSSTVVIKDRDNLKYQNPIIGMPIIQQYNFTVEGTESAAFDAQRITLNIVDEEGGEDFVILPASAQMSDLKTKIAEAENVERKRILFRKKDADGNWVDISMLDHGWKVTEFHRSTQQTKTNFFHYRVKKQYRKLSPTS